VAALSEPTHQLGDAAAEDTALMRRLAGAVNQILNGSREGHENDRVGFVLMVFPFAATGARCNYVSNAVRSDVLALLRDQVRRFEEKEKKEGQ